MEDNKLTEEELAFLKAEYIKMQEKRNKSNLQSLVEFWFGKDSNERTDFYQTYPLVLIPEGYISAQNINNEIGKWLLDSNKPLETTLTDVTHGITEFAFLYILRKKFPDFILYGQELSKYDIDTNKTYLPDFVYHNIEKNLLIDIEIDEPYQYKTKAPTHFIELDASRNRFFNNNKWFIIRFAEEQIVKYPLECADLIEAFVDFILNPNTIRNSQMLNQFFASSAINTVWNYSMFIKCWSREDCVSMANKDYRDSYLNFSDDDKRFFKSDNRLKDEFIKAIKPTEQLTAAQLVELWKSEIN